MPDTYSHFNIGYICHINDLIKYTSPWTMISGAENVGVYFDKLEKLARFREIMRTFHHNMVIVYFNVK